ncbi:virion protein [Glossina pallidipes salivary gland hypertrophy virus]|uniref:Virion protein n=1 Tax=Glossina hytrovirus (isolate Glossina pallidipes/Ethiopia/Seibersdorf/-) TaxID=379529 RepID=A0A109QSU6_GHVS|nr:virion protein [Glossina pallidipes salivary gland hypertrophy virus]
MDTIQKANEQIKKLKLNYMDEKLKLVYMYEKKLNNINKINNKYKIIISNLIADKKLLYNKNKNLNEQLNEMRQLAHKNQRKDENFHKASIEYNNLKMKDEQITTLLNKEIIIYKEKEMKIPRFKYITYDDNGLVALPFLALNKILSLYIDKNVIVNFLKKNNITYDFEQVMTNVALMLFDQFINLFNNKQLEFAINEILKTLFFNFSIKCPVVFPNFKCTNNLINTLAIISSIKYKNVPINNIQMDHIIKYNCLPKNLRLCGFDISGIQRKNSIYIYTNETLNTLRQLIYEK